jgi:catechol 2,3-dioxygenase-like lactoylglutathione lyase family enzyme
VRFHHLGVACGDLAVEARRFEALGYSPEGAVFRDPIQKVEGIFLTGPGPRLELLAPLDPSAPIHPWIEKGVKYYHQAFEVPSLADAVARMEEAQGHVVAHPAPSTAFGGRPIAFVMLPGMILVEMIQETK